MIWQMSSREEIPRRGYPSSTRLRLWLTTAQSGEPSTVLMQLTSGQRFVGSGGGVGVVTEEDCPASGSSSDTRGACCPSSPQPTRENIVTTISVFIAPS